MRKFDHEGLLISEYQGKLFEKSYELNCSTGVFIRRFLHSELLERMDSSSSTMLSMDVNDGIVSITEEFGDTTYGSLKYSPNVLFWIGYLYRYISYTRETPTKFVMEIFDYKQLNNVYFSFHTQDPEWCIRGLLEINNLTENVFDRNYRLKQIMKDRKYNVAV